MQTTKDRILEIEATLNAYRQGWISYDRTHVLELRTERLRLLETLKAAA